jgi:hypothetical protein
MDTLLRLPLDEAFQRKLRTATTLSENGEEGDVHFVQVSHCPVTSLFLITGEARDNSNLHHVTLRIVGQTAEYPPFPANMYSSQKKGYKYHLEKARELYEADNSLGFSPLDFQTYREMFMNICQHIDAALRANHGIKCYHDGNVNNDRFSNTFFMHVCDVLNILKCERNNSPVPTVYIQTPLLEHVSFEWRNILIHSMLTEYELEFLYKEIDYFYTCYCHFGNFSFLPIRTRVDQDCTVFVRSSFFTNNDHFIEHQRGKMKELNQNYTEIPTMIAYRSM